MGDAYARRHRRPFRRALQGTGINEMGAIAVSSIDQVGRIVESDDHASSTPAGRQILVRVRQPH